MEPVKATLTELLRQSAEQVKAMTPEAREAMFKAQREGYARAEASWPKPNFHYENEVKVYRSYKDYLND